MLKAMKLNIQELLNSKEAISKCRFSIENMMSSTTNAAIEQHADLFNDGASDSNNSGDGWDEFGSDVEEINE